MDEMSNDRFDRLEYYSPNSVFRIDGDVVHESVVFDYIKNLKRDIANNYVSKEEHEKEVKELETLLQVANNSYQRAMSVINKPECPTK